MSQHSAIEWTDATWNPVTGCTKISPGCDHCYAATLAERFRDTPGHYFEHGFDVQLRPDKLTAPLHWRRPQRIFVNSMSDLFHPAVPDEFIARVFAVMAATPEHTYQVLTKRHARMRSLLSSPLFGHLVVEQGRRHVAGCQKDWLAVGKLLNGAPLPNVWLGVSAEDQKRAELRIPALLATPAAVRFVSCEPLLGPIDLRSLTAIDGAMIDCLAGDVESLAGEIYGACPAAIDWVIAGGESGAGARPMHPDWPRGLREQCSRAGVAFFFKQWGEYLPESAGGSRPVRVGKKAAGRVLDGRTWDQFPHR